MAIRDAGITRGDMVRYALLPGILPRLRNVSRISLGNLAFIMALVFQAVRILPDTHPYLNPSNTGTFGVRHVIAQAANHLKPEWKHADQIIIFFAILSAIAILALQFILILAAALIGTSRAASAAMPTGYAGFFKTPDPENDIAFRLMDMVFGIPHVFGSKEIAGGPTPMQNALHGLFEFYSFGLLVVGCFIILYFVVTIVAETAQSGTPFGRRFNAVWAPIRLVVFFALLLPVTMGLNGGQMITLIAAKYGSGLATNGWLLFNNVISGKYLGEAENLVGKPQTPDMAYLFDYMILARSCAFAEGRAHGRKIEAFIITGQGGLPISTSFQDASEVLKGGNVQIRFGEKDETKYKKEIDNIYPHCGALSIFTSDVAEPGSAKMQEKYLDLVRKLWNGAHNINTYAENFNLVYSTVFPRNPAAALPDSNYKPKTVETIEKDVTDYIAEAVQVQIDEGEWGPDENMQKVGWAGAGIWYNKVAQQNGAMINAVQGTPKVQLMPRVMDYVHKEKTRQDRNILANDMYTPTLSSGEIIKFEEAGDADIALVLNNVFAYTKFTESANKTKMTGNIIIDMINTLFGTTGLYEMCRNTDIHPLAQLSAMGKSMIESSIAAMGFSVIGGVFGGAMALLSQHQIADVGLAAASMFVSIAGIGLLLGFILFYVIPFMPFMYFFFAVGSWIKSLFEAMVGIPLWALAHLRIDGEGLPGQAASQGYFLIFEIFLRPIIIVFGLLAAIAIFAAMVKVLNEIFYLVVANTMGHDPTMKYSCFNAPDTEAGQSGGGSGGSDSDVATMFRGPIDEFFFTIIYAIIVYMIGVSCFKLIDIIPDNVMRWLEEGVATFGAKDIDPAEGLMQRVAGGGGMIGSQLQGGLSNIGSAFKQ